MECRQIYVNVESQHKLLTKIIFKSLVAAAIGLFSIAAMQPVAYVIFDYPQPQHWLLPVEIQ